MAPPTFPQKCLAFHGPMLYEAKTLRIYDPETKTTYYKGGATIEPNSTNNNTNTNNNNNTTAHNNNNNGSTTTSPATDGPPVDLPKELQDNVAYFIHYKGWKSTWDEWVSDERVLAWNEENLRTQKELKQMALAAASKKKSFIHLDVDGPSLVSSVAAAAAASGGTATSTSGVSSTLVGGSAGASPGLRSADLGHHHGAGMGLSAVSTPSLSTAGRRRESGLRDELPYGNGRPTKRGRGGYSLDTDKVSVSSSSPLSRLLQLTCTFFSCFFFFFFNLYFSFFF